MLSNDISVPVSPGELIDKITILEIKQDKIKDEKKLVSITTELNLLSTSVAKNIEMTETLSSLKQNLKKVNQKLWVIEDDIRDCERHKNFGETFIELARSVYITNDERAVLKRKINEALGSNLKEEKSYASYK